MSDGNVLVTGASGFIGTHLAKELRSRGKSVTCLVRKTSDISRLEKYGCEFVYGDVTNPAALVEATTNQDTVFHLAANTKALTSGQLFDVNVGGTKSLLDACQQCPSPPTVVLVSSLAAAGPSTADQPRIETDPCRPVSQYGRSKEKAEATAYQYESQVPVSIVRPPIVLGDGDRDGLALFKSIDRSGIHLMPGFGEDYFSIIHADDLVEALILVAEKGQRVATNHAGQGIYFASSDEIVSYRDLGKMVGRAVGRSQVRIWRTPKLVIQAIGGLNSTFSQISRRPRYLNFDKAREIRAGTWTCSNEKIKSELGFATAAPLAERLQQTADWYREHGWLTQARKSETVPSPTDDSRDMATG